MLGKGESIRMVATGGKYTGHNRCVVTPANEPRDSLEAGEVG